MLMSPLEVDCAPLDKRAAPSMEQSSRVCAVTMPIFSTLPAIFVGRTMVKIFLVVLVLQPSPHLAKPLGDSFDAAPYDSGIS